MKRIKAFTILVMAMAMVTGSQIATAWCSNENMEQETLALVREYETRLGELTGEIDDLKENKAWLELKIHEIKLLKKPVPKSLYRSLAYKAARIEALEKSEQAISDYLTSVRHRLPPQTLPGKKDKKMVSIEEVGLTDSQNKLKEEISAYGLLEWFKMRDGEDGGILLKTALPILFSSGSAKVAESYQPFLKKVADFVGTHKAWIVVDGYADTDPIKTKKYPSNFELGAIRAANIVHSLVDFGADPSMFKLASTGEYRFPDARPMTTNKSIERYVNLTLAFE